MMGTCRLCLQLRTLQRSHICPEWGYAGLYGRRPRRFYKLTDTPGAKVGLPQIGIREPLLCFDCEQKLNKHEDYTCDLFRTPDRLVVPPLHGGAMNQADYALFKLFQLSLLWRAHIASDPHFSAVRLGATHAERLHVMLDSESPCAPYEYPCALQAIYYNGALMDWYMAPVGVRKENAHREYWLHYAGFFWIFLVASHVPDDAIVQEALRADGSFPISTYDASASDAFRTFRRRTWLANRDGLARDRRPVAA